MQIRLRSETDIEPCVALLRRTHEVDGYPVYLGNVSASFLSAYAREEIAWVAEIDRQVVGHVALHRTDLDPTLPLAQAASGLPAERLTVLARLLVSPDARRLGVARRLVQTAVAYAHACDLRAVLDVVTDAHGPIAMYTSLGWERVGALTLPVPEHPPLDVWVYLAPAARTC